MSHIDPAKGNLPVPRLMCAAIAAAFLAGCGSELATASQLLQEGSKQNTNGGYSAPLADCMAQELQKQLSKEAFSAMIKRMQDKSGNADNADAYIADRQNDLLNTAKSEKTCRAK